MSLETFDVPALAKRWGCKADAVRSLIRAGRLRAFTLNPEAQRPRFKIAASVVIAYENGDGVVEPRKPAPKFRRRRRGEVDLY